MYESTLALQLTHCTKNKTIQIDQINEFILPPHLVIDKFYRRSAVEIIETFTFTRCVDMFLLIKIKLFL